MRFGVCAKSTYMAFMVWLVLMNETHAWFSTVHESYFFEESAERSILWIFIWRDEKKYWNT